MKCLWRFSNQHSSLAKSSIKPWRLVKVICSSGRCKWKGCEMSCFNHLDMTLPTFLQLSHCHSPGYMSVTMMCRFAFDNCDTRHDAFELCSGTWNRWNMTGRWLGRIVDNSRYSQVSMQRHYATERDGIGGKIPPPKKKNHGIWKPTPFDKEDHLPSTSMFGRVFSFAISAKFL